MKTYLVIIVSFFVVPASAQYYYKDIVGTKETSELIRQYMNNKVSRVQLTSYDVNNTKNDKFYVEQVFTPQFLKTITRSGDEDPSNFISFINNQGQVIKTVDSSDAFIATTLYTYNPGGSLTSIHSTSSDSSRTFVQTEEHKWEYNGAEISRMLRIKNGTDTSFVQFKRDERGNISEETVRRKGVVSEPVYYYYNAENRLTDIVRFNTKVKRLLPEYMFEYSPAGQVIQRITVPANNSDYLIWRYQYDATGLKIREAIYTKQKQLTGKIEYVYQKG
jgi:hypothetical protein